MDRSKLIPILKSFSKAEIKEFDKFLNSPFFGCKKFVLNFYRVLIKYYPEFHEDKIQKPEIFSILYGDKKYNDALVRRIISDLIRFSEDYLTYKNFKKNNTSKNSSILSELRTRHLDDQFRIRSESILKRINSSESIEPNLLLETYLVNLEIKEFRTFIRDSKMHENYSHSVEVFIVYFLRLIYSYINHSATFSNEYKFNNELITALVNNFDFKAFLKHLENNDSKYSKYLKMVFYTFNIVNDKSDRESYFKLKYLLENYQSYFTNSELKNIYIQLSKFFSYQNKNHDNIFLNESFEAYNFFLTGKILPEPPSKFQLSFCRNYISICKQTGETEQIRIFHKKYSDYFPEEYREDLINLCESIYLFEKKMFEKSLNCASKINVDKDIFKKDVRIQKLKNYYELGYIDSVYTELDNLKHFLSSSNNLGPDTLKKAKKFVKIFSDILKLKAGKPGTDADYLRIQLEREKDINEKKWLISKVLNFKF
ncbi:MAG TPA: hypothetical protein PKC58_15840 [Ignavibacteria bacterium]|nr:hypothetical protein [Ignavibacteria bacterium]